jgi:branched-chain amino acid aminotransferase
MSWICFNGDFISSEQAIFKASNRSYRYGAGLFETIKVVDSVILHAARHFERLFNGISLLRFKPRREFTTVLLQESIRELLSRNNCKDLARVRLSVSSGDGGLQNTEEELQYLIECWPIEGNSETKIRTGIYPHARKAIDIFSNLKSANFLPYVMSAEFAKSNGWDEAIVLNSFERVADASSSNLFVVNQKTINTPPLSEGCVNGIFRNVLLDTGNELEKYGYHFIETPLNVADLLASEEIFLTNSISGIKVVSEFQGKLLPHKQTSEIKKLLAKKIPI